MKLRAFGVATLLAMLAVPASASAAKGNEKGDEVTVMTRNIYLGSDLTPALEAPDFAAVTRANADILAEVDRTNFPARAKVLADEIKKEKPDLVGLQEVATWRLDVTEPDGDLGTEFGGTPAETVRYDFLQLLRDALAAAGANYKVAVIQQEFDQELPVEDRPGDGHEDPSDPNGLYDGRLTMHDVILARKGVKYSKPKGGNFQNLYTATISGAPITVERGWTSVEAKVNGQRFRFVNTHLEAFGDPAIRAAQAGELVAKGGPANSKKDVVLVGDMNSSANDDKATRAAYDAIRKAGFVERQVKGGTSGHDDSLTVANDQNQFKRTIDLIFVNNPKIKLDKKGSSIVGRDDPKKRTPEGLWPSDHAGVVSALLFP